MEKSKNIKVTAANLAATYAGYYLGAGFLSGQEIWQFFGSYGRVGILGVGISMLVFFILCLMLFYIGRTTGLEQFDHVIVRFEKPWMRNTLSAVQILFCFTVFVVMAAGGGSLLEQTFGLNPTICSAIFCAAVAVVAAKGIMGMISSLTLLVPILTGITLVIAFWAIIKNGGAAIDYTRAAPTAGIKSSTVFATLTYISYCFLGAVCVLAPIAMHTTKKTAHRGMGLGAMALTAIAYSVFFAVLVYRPSAQTALPILAIARHLNPILSYTCAVPLLLGMFCSSLSSFVSVLVYGAQHSNRFYAHRKLMIIILAFIAWVCSRFGFVELIAVVYPIFGYVGFLVIGFMVEHYIHTRIIAAKSKGAEAG